MMSALETVIEQKAKAFFLVAAEVPRPSHHEEKISAFLMD